MLRRLHTEQPADFAFTADNHRWAEAQIAKYPEGRQASAVIPLLWRGQEQEGWVTKPMIEAVADMLGLAYIRVLEVASFYFMFQLKPVGSVAHFQICGTTSCMICGAEDLVAVCKDRIASSPHALSADGKFSWEEVECLGACSNAPMAQIGKDYYEDLTAARFAEIIDAFAAGEVPTPGPQNGRYASEPRSGLTSLEIPTDERVAENASMELARLLGDTNTRITDGRGISRPTPDGFTGAAPTAPAPAVAPMTTTSPAPAPAAAPKPTGAPTMSDRAWTDRVSARSGLASAARGQTDLTRSAVLTGEDSLRSGVGTWRYQAAGGAAPEAAPAGDGTAPALLSQARDGGADDLKLIKGVGPKLEGVLNDMGVYHFDQIASWTTAEIAWVDERLSFKGRIERDGWVEQAAALAKGGS